MTIMDRRICSRRSRTIPSLLLCSTLWISRKNTGNPVYEQQLMLLIFRSSSILRLETMVLGSWLLQMVCRLGMTLLHLHCRMHLRYHHHPFQLHKFRWRKSGCLVKHEKLHYDYWSTQMPWRPPFSGISKTGWEKQTGGIWVKYDIIDRRRFNIKKLVSVKAVASTSCVKSGFTNISEIWILRYDVCSRTYAFKKSILNEEYVLFFMSAVVLD